MKYNSYEVFSKIKHDKFGTNLQGILQKYSDKTTGNVY